MHLKGSLFNFFYLKNRNYFFIFNYLEFLYYILHKFNYFNKMSFFKINKFLYVLYYIKVLYGRAKLTNESYRIKLKRENDTLGKKLKRKTLKL